MKNKAVYFSIGTLIIIGLSWFYVTKSNDNEVENLTKSTVVFKMDTIKPASKSKEEVIKKVYKKEGKMEEKTASQIQSDMMKDILKKSK